MHGRDLVGFAFGGLRGHRLRSALTILGVGIGVAAVIMLTSLGEGARRYVVGEFASLGTNLLITIPGKTETEGQAPLISRAPNDLTLDDAEALLREIPAIEKMTPVVVGGADIEYAGRSRDITVVGSTHSMLSIRQLSVRTGRFLPEGVTDAPVCVLGAKVARELFDFENPLGERVRIGGMRARVIGVLESRGTSVGIDIDEVVQVPVENALRLFDRSSLFRILLQVRTPDQMESAKRAATDLMIERHGTDDVTFITQDAVLSTFDRILSSLTMALAAIAAISLAVAGIGIMNVMLVAVSERQQEIGLLKSLGVTNAQVQRLFLVEAAVLSVVGGLSGMLVGYAGIWALRSYVPAFPAQPPVWAVVLALGVSVGVGIVFGALPARKAMRLDPVQALMRQRR